MQPYRLIPVSQELTEHWRFISTLIIDFDWIGFGEFGLGKVIHHTFNDHEFRVAVRMLANISNPM
jgi:hypothetical protein